MTLWRPSRDLRRGQGPFYVHLLSHPLRWPLIQTPAEMQAARSCLRLCSPSWTSALQLACGYHLLYLPLWPHPSREDRSCGRQSPLLKEQVAPSLIVPDLCLP